MTCPACKGLVDWPSEVGRGLAIGVCPFCGHLHDPTYRPPKVTPPDMRGAPSKPGG